MKYISVIFLFLLHMSVMAQQLDSSKISALGGKLAEYYDALKYESIDVQKQECDFLIEAATDTLVRQFVAQDIYDHYINSPVMGAENVAVHVFDRWFADGKTQQLWTAKLGKGTLYIFPEPSNYEGNKAQFATFMKKHIDPKITCSKNNFQYSYLEYKGKRFLYLLNSSLDKTSTAELSLSGKYDISDIGMPEKQKVSAVYKDGRTWFKIRLAPAGMTLLEITK